MILVQDYFIDRLHELAAVGGGVERDETSLPKPQTKRDETEIQEQIVREEERDRGEGRGENKVWGRRWSVSSTLLECCLLQAIEGLVWFFLVKK